MNTNKRMKKIADRCRERAAAYLNTSKSYTCHSDAEKRAGLVKGAAVLEMVARWIDEESKPTRNQTNLPSDKGTFGGSPDSA